MTPCDSKRMAECDEVKLSFPRAKSRPAYVALWLAGLSGRVNGSSSGDCQLVNSCFSNLSISTFSGNLHLLQRSIIP
jgi:hypothetical protein